MRTCFRKSSRNVKLDRANAACSSFASTTTVGSRAMRSEPTNALVPRGLEGRKALPATLTIANGRKHTAETVIRAWLAGKSDHTIRAYQRDLEAFAVFLSLQLGIRPAMTVYATLDRFFAQSA